MNFVFLCWIVFISVSVLRSWIIDLDIKRYIYLSTVREWNVHLMTKLIIDESRNNVHEAERIFNERYRDRPISWTYLSGITPYLLQPKLRWHMKSVNSVDQKQVSSIQIRKWRSNYQKTTPNRGLEPFSVLSICKSWVMIPTKQSRRFLEVFLKITK